MSSLNQYYSALLMSKPVAASRSNNKAVKQICNRHSKTRSLIKESERAHVVRHANGAAGQPVRR